MSFSKIFIGKKKYFFCPNSTIDFKVDGNIKQVPIEDGVTEIKDPSGEMLGAEGFQNYIKKFQDRPSNERLKNMVEDIVKSGKIQKDDLTIVVVDGK